MISKRMAILHLRMPHKTHLFPAWNMQESCQPKRKDTQPSVHQQGIEYLP